MENASEERQMDKLVEELRRRKAKVLEGGGAERTKAQHDKGKLTARERLALLFDEGSFNEIGTFAVTQATEFDLDKAKYYGDGVVTGWGKVDGRVTFAFAQDFTVLGGSLGAVHASKIVKVYDMALKVGSPVVGINDSGGARIQEGAVSLEGYGQVFRYNVIASGIIPQISIIAGPAAGGAVYSPALTDFVVMIKGEPYYMFVTGPEVTKIVLGEEVTYQQLGGAEVHSTKSGVVHFVVESEPEAFDLVRRLLSYLPPNNMYDPPYMNTNDPVEREISGVEGVPTDPLKGYDIHQIIYKLVDNGEFLEVHRDWARNMVVGFARIGGITVGLVANNPSVLGGSIDIDAANKAARFIRFCDAFNIPLLSLVDTPGYIPGTEQEYGGIIRHGAKMLYAFAEATVPKVTLILRKSYGGAYIAMSTKSLGADLVYAWPSAEIAVMGPEGAVRILYRKQIQASDNPEEIAKKKIEEYRKLFANPYWAAEKGLIDDVIEPKDTRKVLYYALEVLRNKREQRPPKKHGNIPL